MNTRIILSSSAILMGIMGLIFSFLPQETLSYAGMAVQWPAPLLVQILSALYLAAAMMNWMSKSNLIGGIYARPLAMFNMMHFVIGSLALIKSLSGGPFSPVLTAATIVYTVYAILFSLILFRHPANNVTIESNESIESKASTESN